MPTDITEQGSGTAATPRRKKMARPKKDAGDNPAETATSEVQAPAQETLATPSKPPTDGAMTITNLQMAGKVVVAVMGKAIVFDKDGKATADVKDAKYLAGFMGYTVAE